MQLKKIVISMTGSVSRLATALLLAAVVVPAMAQMNPDESKKLAAEVPIADVHMHLYRGLVPADLLSAMDRNNVRWGGGVGPLGPGYDPKDFSKVLGKRYFSAGAMSEFYELFQMGGASALQDASSDQFKALVKKVTAQFEEKEITGIGELILSNNNSSFAPQFRRKVKINGETVQILFGIAEKYKGYVQLHMENDSDSVQELESVISRFPSVPVILSHCMKATAPEAKSLLERYPNLYCETSYRSSARSSVPGLQQSMIHTTNQADSAWLALMEAMPDRFMVGSDFYVIGNFAARDVSYDSVVQSVRSGLLPYLSASTLKKVAFENAQRVFRLPDIAP
jgi:predicted TIM-barrel fold metal-dependent hydrolase